MTKRAVQVHRHEMIAPLNAAIRIITL